MDFISSAAKLVEWNPSGETSQQFKSRKYRHQKDVERKNKNNGMKEHNKQNIAYKEEMFVDSSTCPLYPFILMFWTHPKDRQKC